MKRRRFGALASVGAAGLLLGACKTKGKTSRPPKPEPSPFAALPYRDGPVAPETRIFLVAGGDDIANFAAEVREQRDLWLAAGFAPEEIACYYAKPTERAWRKDTAQYKDLLPFLRECYAAEPGRLRRDLAATSQRAPSWIYLYISAHGIDSLLELGLRSRNRRVTEVLRGLDDGERDRLDRPAIGLQAGPAPRMENVVGLVRSLRRGAKPGDVLLSPDTLYEWLSPFGGRTRKIAVLQSCFSGGFIDHHRPTASSTPARWPTLRALPNVVGVTATAADRPSFGCGSGQNLTYFGAAWLGALADHLSAGRSPLQMAWRAVFEQTAYAVEVMEAVEGERPSVPGYFENARPELTTAGREPNERPGV